MNKIVSICIVCLSLGFITFADETKTAAPAAPQPAAAALTIREIRYDGRLSDDEARFILSIEAEAAAGSSTTLLEGDVAVLPAKLPDSLKIVRDGNRYNLIAARPGKFKFQLEVVTKIQRAEPWNQISFTG